ncbi:transposase [Beggiatoa sp. PS]|nr:transposase [Beggiatoa sp. PS]
MAVTEELSNAQTNNTFITEPILERSEWASHEFGNALLGDPRRTDRLIKIAKERAAKPSVSLPQCFDKQSELKAAYRFYDNPGINREAILKSHYLATQERLNQENVVLAVSDTTEVDYSHYQSKQGLGYLHDRNHHGFLLHSTEGVTPSKVPLGLLDQQIIYRDEKDFGKKHDRKKRPIEEKESYKWLKNLEAVAEAQKNHPDVLIVNVADRESDIYDYFVRAQNLNDQALLIRCAWNRCIDDDDQNYLWEYVESQDEAGILPVEIPRKPGTSTYR